MKVHIIQGNTAIFHFPTPSGNNAAGFPWVDVIVNSGRNRTSMTVGTGPGQILQAEKDAIVAGTIIEVSGSVQLSTEMTQQERDDYADQQADNQISGDYLPGLISQFNFFGYTKT